MPLFSSSSPFDADVEKATSELNTSENWQLIMEICDRISREPNGPKDALRAILKRISNRNPHIAMQGLTLLSACVNNCGRILHLEICSRDFVSEAKIIIQSRTHLKVQEKFKELIVEMEAMFKDDPQLCLISNMKDQLKADGVDFPSSSKSSGSTSSLSKKTSSSSSSSSMSKEEEDLARAIQLSLQETESSQPKVSSLYPSVQSSPSSSSSNYASIKKVQRKKVKALYDFEAAEDNELTFKAGDIIAVLDDSDANWWKGETYDGSGLFPSNFVTTDLSEPKPVVKVERKKRVRWADTPAGQQGQQGEQQQQQQQQQVRKPELNESMIEQCLTMLKAASVETEDEQEDAINELEDTCHGMGIVVDEKIEKSKKKHQDLSSLNEQYLQALALYQKLMKEPLPIPPTPSIHAVPGYMPQGAMAGYQQPVAGYQPPQYQQVYASQVPTGYPHVTNPQATQASMTMNSAYPSQGPGLPSYQGAITTQNIPQGYPAQVQPTQAPPQPQQYVPPQQMYAPPGVPQDYSSLGSMQQYQAQSLPVNSLPGYPTAHQPQMVYSQQQLL